MKKSIISFLFISILSSFSLHSQNSQLENLSPKIDSLLALQHSANQPGGVIGVIHANKILHKKAYGIMDLHENRSIDENTLFDMASVAKQFTAFAVLLLEQQGKINLDSDIRKYIPGLPEYEYTVTVRHLLQHTSGIASTDWLRLLSGKSLDEKWTHNDEINIIVSYPQLNFKPNTAYAYSNAGYSLLATIVEKVSGKPFAEFVRENLFAPIHMQSSLIYLGSEMDVSRFAKGYGKVEGEFSHISSISDYSYGSGNLFSNLTDMMLWGQNFLTPALGSQKIMNRIFNKYNTLENGDSIGYTYGFNVRNHKGVKMVEQSGGLPGFRNQFMVFPEEQLVVVLMFNNESINTRNLALGIAEIILSDKLAPEEPAKPRVEIALEPAKAKKFEGTYRMPDGMEMGFALEDDTFWLLLPGDTKFRLYAESDTRFFVKEFEAGCSFVVEDNGEVYQMIWHQSGRDFQANRIEDTEPLSPEQLALLAGDYYQPRLMTEYPIIFENGSLTMSLPSTFGTYLGFDSMQLSHISGDRFMTDRLGIMEFTRDKNDQVIGFILFDVGRMKNIEFVRK